MNNNCQLSEEEILDLRREMREDLENILFELKKKEAHGLPVAEIAYRKREDL